MLGNCVGVHCFLSSLILLWRHLQCQQDGGVLHSHVFSNQRRGILMEGIGPKDVNPLMECKLAQAPPEKLSGLQYVNISSLAGVQHRLVGLAATPQQDGVWTGPKYRRKLLKLPNPQSTRFDTPDTGLCVGKGVIVQIVQEVSSGRGSEGIHTLCFSQRDGQNLSHQPVHPSNSSIGWAASIKFV